MTYHLDQSQGASCQQLPTFSEQTPAVTMAESRRALPGLVQRDPARLADFPRRTEFLGQNPGRDDDSQIVQQSRKVRFAGIAKFNFACQPAANQGASQGMLPEDNWIRAVLSPGPRFNTPQDMAMSLT